MRAHAWPVAQTEHDAPAEPHASFEMPLKHEPVSSQQPSQLLALQRVTIVGLPHDEGSIATPRPSTAPSTSAREEFRAVDMTGSFSCAPTGQSRACLCNLRDGVKMDQRRFGEKWARSTHTSGSPQEPGEMTLTH